MKAKGVNVKGQLPVIQNLKSPMFQRELNNSIDKKRDEIIDLAVDENIKNITFSYETVTEGNVLSVIIYGTNPAKYNSFVKSICINKNTDTYIKIRDVLGQNGIEYANDVISGVKAQNPHTKYFGDCTVSENRAFYFKNNNIIILFGAGEIAPISKGVLSFEVNKSGIKNFVVKNVNLFTKDNYKVKMLPLRVILQNFGYETLWNKKDSSISIKKNNTVITSIVVGRNSYRKMGASPRQLEYPPEIKNGNTYVPISFFTEILSFYASSDDNGNVTVSVA